MGTFPILTADLLDLTIDIPDFQDTINNTLGNAGTPSDGFDGAVSDVLSILAAAPALLAIMDDDGGVLGGILGLIDPNSLDADAASFPASVATGNSIISDSNDLLGSIGGAAPPPAPSSGGGGPSTGTIDCFTDTNCDSIVTFGGLNSSSLPCTIIAQLPNNYSVPMHVTGVTIDQPASNPFTTDLKAGAIVPARSLIAFHVTAVKGTPNGTYCGVILIDNDSPLPHLRWCVRMSIEDAGGPCAPGSGPPQKPGGR